MCILRDKISAEESYRFTGGDFPTLLKTIGTLLPKDAVLAVPTGDSVERWKELLEGHELLDIHSDKGKTADLYITGESGNVEDLHAYYHITMPIWNICVTTYRSGNVIGVADYDARISTSHGKLSGITRITHGSE